MPAAAHAQEDAAAMRRTVAARGGDRPGGGPARRRLASALADRIGEMLAGLDGPPAAQAGRGPDCRG